MVKSAGLGLLLSLVTIPGFAGQWSGIVDWSQRTDLSTTVSGIVTRVAVNAGERVKKGQLLLQLEQGALQARREQGKAEMRYKELMLKEARRELERAEELYAGTLLADHDLELAKIAHAKADAAYKTSRAAYQQAREDLENSSLRAPFEAVVLARNIQPAQAVVSRCEAQPLLTLVSATQMRVRIFVEAATLESLRNSREVTVEVAGQQYAGGVGDVGYEPELVNESIRYPVEILFAAEDPLLVGQGATVSQP